MKHLVLAIGLLALLGSAQGFEAPPKTSHVMENTGYLQLAFTPGDDADDLIIQAINSAQKEVLVQAFSFTHRDIAQALSNAYRRGVNVILIADSDQAENIVTSQVDELARKIPVFLDRRHASAHNKIMVIDGQTANPTVITGSYNFTFAAQHKNAENLLVFRANPGVTEAYRQNWLNHFNHSLRHPRSHLNSAPVK